ncbi:MAG: hypothetical protein VB137_06830 [Burkholderia sp.]
MIAAMATSRKRKHLSDAYRFEGFRPLQEIHDVFGDRVAPVIALVRRSKKRPELGATGYSPGYGRKQPCACDLSSGTSHIYLAFEVRGVRCQCDGTVKRERLSFLADNPHDTQQFAW